MPTTTMIGYHRWEGLSSKKCGGAGDKKVSSPVRYRASLPARRKRAPPKTNKVRALCVVRDGRLVSGAQFLAGKAIASPRDGFETQGGNFLVASFAGAVSAAGTAT